MMSAPVGDCRYFVSYSGVKLPLNLVTPLEAASLNNRNTYFRAWFDTAEQLIACEKITYGEVELSHRYEYYRPGVLKQAVIINADDERSIINFSEQGEVLSSELVVAQDP